MNCETAYHSTGNPQAGLLAAQALSRLGRPEAIIQWADRLEDVEAQAAAWALAGLTSAATGDFEGARGAYVRELELREPLGDPRAIATSAYGVAYFARALSDYSSALDHFEIAHRAYIEASDPKLAALSIEGLHDILREIGDLEGARLLLDRAEEANPAAEAQYRFTIGRGLLDLQSGRPRLAQAAFEDVLGKPTSPMTRRSAHLNLVEAYLQTGDQRLAEQHITAALDLVVERVSTEDALLLALRGKTLARGGNLEDALKDFDHALSLSPGPNQTWEIHFEKGRIHELRGDLRAAEAAYSEAIEVIDAARASVGPDDYRERLLAKRRRPHERLFRLQAQRGSIVEALATAEKIKARTFMDAFVHATSSAPRANGSSPAEAVQRGRERLRGLSQVLPALSHSPVTHGRPLSAVLESLRDRYLLFFLQVEEDELWRIEIVAGRPIASRLEPEANRIAVMAGRLISTPNDEDLADALGAALLDGASLPEADSEIFVITDGPLGGLPFGLLRRDGRYLVELLHISYAPSLTALTAIEDRPWTVSDQTALIFADPLGDLPDAAAEGREIATWLGAPALRGSEATFEALTSAGTPRLLHLATHTSIGPLGPTLTLADRSIGAADLLDRPVDPAIVVLASCASASRSGEGLWGSMGGAFLAGGARVVIATQWSVEDRVAREFVSRFYRAGAFQDPLQALTDTQRGLLAEGIGVENWAPFVLLGSTRALMSTEGNGGKE